MISTADWLAYVDSLGPTEAQSLRLRLQSAGLDPQRADWIVSLVWRRQVARAVARAAVVVLFTGVAWMAWQWWLALSGSPSAPGVKTTFIPAALIGIGAMALTISSAVEFSPPFDLFVFRTIPSELAPPPRNVIVGDRRSVAWRIPIGIICLMLIPFSLAAPRVRNRMWLRKQGVETTGRVTRTYPIRGSKGRVTYYVRYDFDHGDGVTTVSSKRFDGYHPGDPIAVTYLPSQPAINLATTKADLESKGLLVDDDGGLVVALLYFLIVLPLFGIVLSADSRQKRDLATRGVAAIATVTRANLQSIEYKFGEQGGRYSFGKRRMRERPAIGQPLVILYDPEKPKRSIPLGALTDIRFSA